MCFAIYLVGLKAINMSMERSFPAHIPLISQTNEKNQNM